MKLLVHSSAPWSTSSYSILVNRTVPDIVRAGHQVVLSTWYGLQGHPLPWQILGDDGQPFGKVDVLPSLDGAQYGANTVHKIFHHVGADALITISDVWVFDPSTTGQTHFCPWLPIDHDPAPPNVVKALESSIYSMVYSQWGAEVLAKEGIEAHYVPASVPADKFTPGDRKAAKEQFILPDGINFVVSMVAANKDGQDRKGFNEALLAFAQFHERHPDSVLYLHTNWEGAINLGAMGEILGIEKFVLRPDPLPYALGLLDENYMTNVYRASDVLLNPAKSEGFGIPLVEAQMCGCPVIATDYSTTDELVKTGWKVDTTPDWTLGADSFRARAKIDSLVDALEDAYAQRDRNEAMISRTRKRVMSYDTKAVFKKYWRPALKEIERRTTSLPGMKKARLSPTEIRLPYTDRRVRTKPEQAVTA